MHQPPPGHGVPPPAYSSQGPMQPPRTKNGMASLAMWLGIASFVTLGLAGVPALFFGWKAKKEVDSQPTRFSNAVEASVGIALGAVGTLMFLFFVVAVVTGKSSASSTRSTRTPPATAATASDQTVFTQLISNADDQYEAAPNEIKKSAIYNGVRAEEQTWMRDHANRVVDWQGKLASIKTDKGGKHLWIQVTFRQITLHQGAIFGAITPNNPVYNQVANLEEGTAIRFSGRFTSGKPSNTTETFAMSDPDYDFYFEDIQQPSGDQ